MKSQKERGDATWPVLSQYYGRHGGHDGAQQAVQSPPRLLQEEAGRDEEPAERVIDEHDLSHSSENPVQQLDYQDPSCQRRMDFI